MDHVRPWDTIKRPKLQVMGTGEEMQTKGTDKLFNNLVAGNLSNLEKGRMSKYRRHSECQISRIRKETQILKHISLKKKNWFRVKVKKRSSKQTDPENRQE
jgi:hypothetical protein